MASKAITGKGLNGAQEIHGDNKTSSPTQHTVTPVSYARVAATKDYDYGKITQKSKETRNTLVAKITNPPKQQSDQNKKPLSLEKWADFLFDELKMDPADAIGLDFTSGKGTSVEIHLHTKVNADKYTGSDKIFEGFNMEISKKSAEETKVVFLNVPYLVPDEEILHLVTSYGGKMKDSTVHREPRFFSTSKGKQIFLQSTTRFVHASFPQDKRLRRYYWVEGPCENDLGRRIIVQHKGQRETQCPWCLQWASECRFAARAASCKAGKTPKATMSGYMKRLADEGEYKSLKSKFLHTSGNIEVEVEEEEEEEDDTNPYDSTAADSEAERDGAKGPPPPPPSSPDDTQANKSNRAAKKKIGSLRKTLQEKDKLILELKETNKKAGDEVIELKKDVIFKNNSITAIKENFRNDLGWKTTGAFTSSTAANILVEKFTYDKMSDKVMTKDGASWEGFLPILGLENVDMNVDRNIKQFKDLQAMVEIYLKDFFAPKIHKQRSESVTRNRSESDQEVPEEQKPKKAKNDEKTPEKPEETEEQKPKKTKNDKTPEKSDKTTKIPPPGKQGKNRNKNGF